jgi:hypothetical protein
VRERFIIEIKLLFLIFKRDYLGNRRKIFRCLKYSTQEIIITATTSLKIKMSSFN